MKNIFKLGLMFMVLELIFFTIPTVNNIARYKNEIPQQITQSNPEIPRVDSYLISHAIEELIRQNHVEKRMLFSQMQDNDLLEITFYEMELEGELNQLIDFLDELGQFEGAWLRFVEWELKEKNSSLDSDSKGALRLQVAFVGGKR